MNDHCNVDGDCKSGHCQIADLAKLGYCKVGCSMGCCLLAGAPAEVRGAVPLCGVVPAELRVPIGAWVWVQDPAKDPTCSDGVKNGQVWGRKGERKRSL